MKASRLVSILMLLQARGRMTAGQLAEELAVSARTVYRDVDALMAAGVPLYGESGHEGGYRLVDGYRTRLTGLTRDEAEAMFLSGLPGAAADLGLGAELASAQLKLMAALPDELRDRAGRVQERFHLDTSGWYIGPDEALHLGAVVEATWQQRALRVRYLRWAEPREVTRTVEPYGLVLKGGRWYLVAGRPVRTYRVSQIREARVLDTPFERPEGFDLARHWTGYLDDFDARRYQGEATIRLTERSLELLPHVWEPDLVKAVRQTARPTGDGRIDAVIPMESADHTARVLLRLGDAVEVLEPRPLRERITEMVARLATAYGVR